MVAVRTQLVERVAPTKFFVSRLACHRSSRVVGEACSMHRMALLHNIVMCSNLIGSQSWLRGNSHIIGMTPEPASLVKGLARQTTTCTCPNSQPPSYKHSLYTKCLFVTNAGFYWVLQCMFMLTTVTERYWHAAFQLIFGLKCTPMTWSGGWYQEKITIGGVTVFRYRTPIDMVPQGTKSPVKYGTSRGTISLACCWSSTEYKSSCILATNAGGGGFHAHVVLAMVLLFCIVTSYARL